MECKNCGKRITNRNAKIFCSRKCYNIYRTTDNYNKYLQDNRIAYGNKHMRNYKKFFLEEQNHRCAICGIPDI